MEDGVVTDAKGRKVYFNNSIIIMTSNIGAEKAFNNNMLGFGDDDSDARVTNIMKKEANAYFRPEFLNRLDNIVVFHQLQHDDIAIIVDLAIAKLNKRIAHRDLIITITNNMKEHIIEKGYNKKFGARPINRTITELIEDYIAPKLLKKEYKDGMTLEFDYNENEVICNIIEDRNNNESGIKNSNESSNNDNNINNVSFMKLFEELSTNN